MFSLPVKTGDFTGFAKVGVLPRKTGTPVNQELAHAPHVVRAITPAEPQLSPGQVHGKDLGFRIITENPGPGFLRVETVNGTGKREQNRY